VYVFLVVSIPVAFPAISYTCSSSHLCHMTSPSHPLRLDHSTLSEEYKWWRAFLGSFPTLLSLHPSSISTLFSNIPRGLFLAEILCIFLVYPTRVTFRTHPPRFHCPISNPVTSPLLYRKSSSNNSHIFLLRFDPQTPGYDTDVADNITTSSGGPHLEPRDRHKCGMGKNIEPR
jgi:hypothetical protein